VDDCLLFAPNEADIENSNSLIKYKGMDIEVEDSVEGFLGIYIQRALNENGGEQITLIQKGLIDHIVNALGFDERSNGINFSYLPLRCHCPGILREKHMILVSIAQVWLEWPCICVTIVGQTLHLLSINVQDTVSIPQGYMQDISRN
jgi:hypothetical protein